MLAFEITVDPVKSSRRVSAWVMARRGCLSLLRHALTGACSFLLAMPSPASAQAPNAADRPLADGEITSIEREVLDNILRQPIGDTTVESLDLPQPFLRRVAGRIIRSTYQHRYHVVTSDATPKPPDGPGPSTGSTTATDREQASPDASKQTRDDQPMPPAKTWLYLIGLGILIATAAGALALRRGRRARR